MDIDYSLNAIRIKKTGFFYKGERKVQYSDCKKLTDSARRKRSVRMMMEHTYTHANQESKTMYNSYLRMISIYTAAGRFPSDPPKAELTDEEIVLGITTGSSTQRMLVGIKTGQITRKMIRDIFVKDVVEEMGWTLPKNSDDDHPSDKQLFGSKSPKSISASGIGDDKETEV